MPLGDLFQSLKNSRTQLIIVVGCAMLYSIAFVSLSVWKYLHFGYNAVDLTIINQVFFNILNGEPFYSTLLGHSYLGDHVNPVILLLQPIYLLWQSPVTLLVIQTLAISASGVFLFLALKALLNRQQIISSSLSSWLPLVLSFLWLLNPYLQRANLYEFHFLTLMPLPFFALLWAYWRKKFGWYLMSIILLLSIREEMAMLVIILALLPILDKREKKWWITPLVGGVTWLVSTILIINYFSPIGLERFDHYYSIGRSLVSGGTSSGSSLLAGYLHHVLSYKTLEFTLLLLLPFLFAPLLAGRWLLLAAPFYLGLALTDQGVMNIFLLMHYSVPLLAVLIIATAFGLLRLDRRDWQLYKFDLKTIVPILPAIFLVPIAYLSVVFGPWRDVFRFDDSGAVDNPEVKWSLLEQIPDSASVLSSNRFQSILSSRQEIYHLRSFMAGKQLHSYVDYRLPQPPDFVLVDEQDLLDNSMERGADETRSRTEKLNKLLEENEYRLVGVEGDWWLYKLPADETEPAQVSQLVAVAPKEQVQCFDAWQITFIGGNNDVLEQRAVPCDDWRRLSDRGRYDLGVAGETARVRIVREPVSIYRELTLNKMGSIAIDVESILGSYGVDSEDSEDSERH